MTALLLGLGILTQIYFLRTGTRNPGLAIPELTGILSIDFTIRIAPIVITFICAIALFIRAKRTPPAAA